LDYFYDSKKISAENPLRTGEFRTLMDFALKLCNLFYGVLNDGRTFRGVYKNANDVEKLFPILQKYSTKSTN